MSNTPTCKYIEFVFTQALVYGIDGWKCDGTDPYILELVIPRGKGGIVTRKEYSNAYYGDFFNYTRKMRGNETLIMSRPTDGLVIVPDYIYI